MTVCMIAAKRTIVAPKGGALMRFSIHALAAPVIRAVLRDAGLRPDEVDEVILSNALGGGGNPARLAALAAGLPERVAGLTIDRQCSGGLDAIGLGIAMIAAGQARVVIAGGAESYSRRPIRLRTDPDGGAAVAYDRPPFSPWPDRDPELADAADQLCIPREVQDAWAINSHAKAWAHRNAISGEIVSVSEEVHDSFTRRLAPRIVARAPVISGTITAANTAVAADGAGFCLMVAADHPAARQGVILERFKSIGADPAMPGLAPVAAIRAVATSQIDQAEIMEAYAAQAIACIQGAGLDPNIVNMRGGALARGHPIGASGAILAVRLFHDLRGTAKTGIAAIAAAGGIGSALLVRGF